jgi:hypothetical protein
MTTATLLLWIDGARTAREYLLTAAVVVAGNDPKPPLTKAEKAKNKEAWKKAEASDKPSAMCAIFTRS